MDDVGWRAGAGCSEGEVGRASGFQLSTVRCLDLRNTAGSMRCWVEVLFKRLYPCVAATILGMHFWPTLPTLNPRNLHATPV